MRSGRGSHALGPLSPIERRTVAVFVVGHCGVDLRLRSSRPGPAGAFDPPVEAVGLAGGLSLFLPGIRVLTWKEAEHDIDWGGIMLIVAGLSLGLAVFEAGAARWLAWVLLGQISSVPDLLRRS